MTLKQRVKSYSFWVSLASAIFLILRVIGENFGFVVDEGLFSEIFTALCSILVLLGIIVPPNAKNKTSETLNNTKTSTNENLETANLNAMGNQIILENNMEQITKNENSNTHLSEEEFELKVDERLLEIEENPVTEVVMHCVEIIRCLLGRYTFELDEMIEIKKLIDKEIELVEEEKKLDNELEKSQNLDSFNEISAKTTKNSEILDNVQFENKSGEIESFEIQNANNIVDLIDEKETVEEATQTTTETENENITSSQELAPEQNIANDIEAKLNIAEEFELNKSAQINDMADDELLAKSDKKNTERFAFKSMAAKISRNIPFRR